MTKRDDAAFEHEVRGLLAAIRLAVEAFETVELPAAHRALIVELGASARRLELAR